MKKSTKVLLISLSILIALFLIYYREPVKVICGKTGTFVAQKANELSVYHKEKKAERKEKREQKKAKKELEKLEAQKSAENELPECPTSKPAELPAITDKRVFSKEELSLLKEQNGVIFMAGDGKRYVTLTSGTDSSAIPEMRYLLIPDETAGVSFMPMDDMVYAASAAKLYGSPSFDSSELATAGKWEAFKRVGISKDCCYQLVTGDGQIVYADGTLFRRYSEAMVLTEEITLRDEKIVLDVSHISQYPSLPNGCEVTSLATVLRFLDFKVTKEELSDNYLPKAKVGEANFYDEFVGNPRNADAYGCYAGAIVTTANAYLNAQGSDYVAKNLTGSSFQDILLKVRDGNPVILWATAYINEDPGFTTEWIVDGEYLIWKTNMHCMVLVGYDTVEKKVIVSDPMRGIEEYDMDLFIKRFKQFYSQAVVIEK